MKSRDLFLALSLTSAAGCFATNLQSNSPYFEEPIYQEACCTPCQLGVSVSFLYLEATMDNLDYAEKASFNLSTDSVFAQVDAQLRAPQFQWKPGVRVELDYAPNACSEWGVSLTGNYLFSHAHDSFDANFANNELATPIWFPNIMGQLLAHASADWKLNFGTLDLELGKNLSTSWIAAYPFFGLRAAWIHQTYQLNYSAAYNLNIVTPPTDLSFTNDNSADFHSDFKAIGPRLGSDFLFPLSLCFNIVGTLGCSLVYGQFDVRQNVNGASPTDDTGSPLPVLGLLETTLHNKFNRLRANFDSEIGVQWARSWRNCELSLGVSYLFSLWLNQLEFHNSFASPAPDPVGAPNFPGANIDPNYQVIIPVNGHLQLQGLVVTAGLAF